MIPPSPSPDNVRRPVRVAFVGQTPPPLYGQALAIRDLLEGHYERVELLHVPMRFSGELAEVGRFRPGKLIELVRVVGRILYLRFARGATVLYYPPAGPDRVPVYRDLVILSLVRPFFPKTVFHFHASGLTTLYPRLSRPLRAWFRRAYFRPAVTIRMSEFMEPDGERLLTRRELIFPHGVEDHYPRFQDEGPRAEGPPRILFLGNLFPEKGVLVLLEACGLLRRRHDFRIELVGGFPSAEAKTLIEEAVTRHQLADRLSMPGLLVGDEKWRRLAEADVFCYPSHFPQEGMPVVLQEAMQFALPVVATRWRGIATVVRDGETGLLVAPQSPPETAAAMERLLEDRDLARRLGRRGREVYLEEFTLDRFRQRLEDALASL